MDWQLTSSLIPLAPSLLHSVPFANLTRPPPRPTTVITPDTPLEELDSFFKSSKSSFALVTDGARKFVLGVVTPEDLQK